MKMEWLPIRVTYEWKVLGMVRLKDLIQHKLLNSPY